ncbi:MAG TPA: class I SAM-dependent methyltransferase [Pyrinomonadaceae bacterium]|nr:class I SAM-dependent methyltransferase [Pyrinomonadaceae bacterium]
MSAFRKVLSSARVAYRKTLASFGRHKLQKMLSDGLPRAFQYPLEFLFKHSLTQSDRKKVARVEQIRKAVETHADGFEVINRDGKVCSLAAAQIAHQVSVNPEWGTFLYLCSTSFRARTILELGGCAGISGCYLASSEYCERFITVEASPELAALARSNINQISAKAEITNAQFDDALDQILPTLAKGLDLVYIDGHHKFEPTLHYFRRVKPYLNTSALVVFDDIHLSNDMWRAWKLLRTMKGVRYAIDAGRFGLFFWDGGSSVPADYNLCQYLGWLWKVSPQLS